MGKARDMFCDAEKGAGEKHEEGEHH